MMASWPNDPLVNVPLCNAAENQGGNTFAVVPSIEGGAIVAWTDQRFVDGDIYAQGGFLTRIFADGFESGDTSEWDSTIP